jgi:uracil-DNA glycosylase family protein
MAPPFLPHESAPGETLHHCTRCDLYANATQAVPGRGPRHAAITLADEQPGDEEGQRGERFSGPAGRLLARALIQAGLQREGIFVTNAVKHFKWTPRGKKRLHETRDQQEFAVCEVWLRQELALVQPQVIVALGATAHRAPNPTRGFTEIRASTTLERDGVSLVVTYHPSAALRVQTIEMRPRSSMNSSTC